MDQFPNSPMSLTVKQSSCSLNEQLYCKQGKQPIKIISKDWQRRSRQSRQRQTDFFNKCVASATKCINKLNVYLNNFPELIKTKQIVIFKARTEKRYIFCYLIKAKSRPHPSGITETIILDIDILSSMVWQKNNIIC